jgi:Asp-tRNA(Asn)/Glu-tRNA(Gln) amidotransferase C subunit
MKSTLILRRTCFGSTTSNRCRTFFCGSGRFLSSSSSFQLPEPTWSVQELELSQQHTPVSEQELKTLARRALLDVDQLDPSTKQQLRQDLGNMLHMIEQVTSFQHPDFDKLDDVAIYDAPRGVSQAPLREDRNINAKHEEEEKAQQQQVWSSFLRPQTTRIGAHEYFSIETKREKIKNNNNNGNNEQSSSSKDSVVTDDDF